MDESWRTPMGMSNFPRRKSTEETLPFSYSFSIRKSFTGNDNSTEAHDPNDFDDVFGGPPRTILSRKLSHNFNRAPLFYEEIFRQPEPFFTPARSGRNLPAFRIPLKRESARGFERNEEFYSDIFGSDDDVRFSSKGNTKSTSSSVLSSEDLSPFRSVNGDDPALTFASKLRPINVPSRWNSPMVMPKDRPKGQTWMPAFQTNPTSNVNNQFSESCYNDSLKYGFSRQVPSPESISIDQNLFGSAKVFGDDIEEINSPLSGVSSVFNEMVHDNKGKSSPDNVMQDEEREAVDEESEYDDDDDDEVMSSYVIEINSDHKDTNCEAISVDDAIAWARERCQTQCSSVPSPQTQGTAAPSGFSSQQSDGDEESHTMMKVVDTKMEQLDEDIHIWSTGKEANIRFLLSTLHHILWQNSGWCAMPILSLIEAHCVKKAYQKARLCLHPDKLQQRGATLPQKYIAEKAFSILQDAWAVFITQNSF